MQNKNKIIYRPVLLVEPRTHTVKSLLIAGFYFSLKPRTLKSYEVPFSH